MTQTIPLIKAEDGFEAVRNAIANILAVETIEQQARASEEVPPEDPEKWSFDVFVERSNPWELFRGVDSDGKQIISVWYENSVLEKQSSNNQLRQTMDSTVNVDCLYGTIATETLDGQVPADEAAMLGANRLSRIARGILMHPKYQRLGLSVVHNRWVDNRQALVPGNAQVPVENTACVRLKFQVRHNETINLEDLSEAERALVTIKADPDGPVVAQANYNWGA